MWLRRVHVPKPLQVIPALRGIHILPPGKECWAVSMSKGFFCQGRVLGPLEGRLLEGLGLRLSGFLHHLNPKP